MLKIRYSTRQALMLKAKPSPPERPVFVGCDPGLSGGFFVVDATGNPLGSVRTPLVQTVTKSGKKKRSVDGRALVEFLRQVVGGRKAVAVVEEVSTFPRDGRVGAFRFGESFGFVQGVFAAMGYDLVLVGPKVWQKALLPRLDGNTKELARKALVVVYGGSVLKGLSAKADNGIVDAALIAEFGRKEWLKRHAD